MSMPCLVIFRCVLGGLLGALATGPAVAETLAELKDRLGEFTADLAMPATPAAVHIGLSADAVVQPRNRRELQVALSNAFKGDGKPALSLEFLPYYIVQGGKLKFSDYESSNSLRALTKTSLGISSGMRSVGDAGAQLSVNGLSVSTVLADLSDPIHHRRFQQCLDGVQDQAIKEARAAAQAKKNGAAGAGDEQPLPGKNTDTGFKPSELVITPKADAAYKDCLGQFRSSAQLWNRSRISLGLASGSGREVAGAKRDVRFGTAAWLSVQYGFEGLATLGRALVGPAFVDCLDGTDSQGDGTCSAPASSRWRDRAMLTLHARQVRGASVLALDTPGDLPRERSSTVGARLTYGSETRNFFVEASRLAARPQDGGGQRTRQHAFGGSFKVMDNLWLNVVSGRRAVLADGKPANVVQVDLAYGLSQDPLVAKP